MPPSMSSSSSSRRLRSVSVGSGGRPRRTRRATVLRLAARARALGHRQFLVHAHDHVPDHHIDHAQPAIEFRRERAGSVDDLEHVDALAMIRRFRTPASGGPSSRFSQSCAPKRSTIDTIC